MLGFSGTVCVFVFVVVFFIVFVFVFVSSYNFWIAFIISFQNMSDKVQSQEPPNFKAVIEC